MAKQKIIKKLTGNPTRIFYGWWMVLAGMLLMFFTTGISFFGFSAFFDAIRVNLKWTRAEVAMGPSIQALQTALMAPFAGFLVDKLGPRIVTSFAMFVGGLGFVVLSKVTEPLHYYVAFILIGTGMGATAYVIVATAVSNWFVQSRGKAMGLTFMGPGFGGILVTLIVFFIDVHGWRPVANFVGLSTWVFAIPLALVLRSAPEKYGMTPDGLDLKPVGESELTMEEPGFSFREVLRHKSYWLYVIACGFQQMAIAAMVVHHIPALVSFGISTQNAGFMILIFTLASLPMRFYAGYLADKYDSRIVTTSMLGFQLIGAILFVAIYNIWVAIIFEIIYGIGWGGSNPARLSLQGRYWGRSIFGSLMGIQIGIGALGGFIAPIFVGWVADMTDYRLAFIFLVIPLVLSVLMIYSMRPPMISKLPNLGDI
jgi:MFS family permease